MPSIAPGDRGRGVAVSVGPWTAKTVGEALQEFAQLGGFDFKVDPAEPTTIWGGVSGSNATPANVPNIGILNIGTYPPIPDDVGRAISQAALDPVFEYGTDRANIASYNVSLSRESMANQIYVPRVGYPEPGRTGTAAHKTAADSASQTAIGRLDAWVDPAGIELDTARQQLADNHLALRKGPRRLITFKPTNNNRFIPFRDYNTGSWVRVVVYDAGVLHFDVYVRIWGMTISLDANGNESVELTTIENGG